MAEKLTKAQIQESARIKAIEASGVDVADMYQIDTGAFIMKIDEQFVELKFIVKGEGFDLADAMAAYKDKVAKAAERVAEKAAKAAAREAKEKAKAEKAE